ncbi:MAG: hypothetical protein V3U92_07490 [Cellulophaga sp.]
MKKLIQISLISGVLLASCSVQKNKIENVYMNCIHENYKSFGKNYKKIILDHEQLLVKEKILADCSGKSYISTIKRMIKDERLIIIPSKSIWEKLNPIEDINKCKTTMLSNSKTDLKKSHKINEAVTSFLKIEEITPSDVAERFLSILSKEDFKSEYYKLKAFYLFEMLNPKWNKPKLLPPIEENSDSN